MSAAAVEFTLDSSYYREFHEEWIRAVGRGWRIDRILVPLFLVVGAGLGVAGMTLDQAALQVPGGLLCLFSLIEHLKSRRKKTQWLAHAMSLPWSGKTMRIEVEDGTLVQKKDFAGDPRFKRTGELLDTPNGYLLRYESDGIEVPSKAISGTSASVYIPHRLIEPPMTRAEFRGLLV
jgi:hypothetical protein